MQKLFHQNVRIHHKDSLKTFTSLCEDANVFAASIAAYECDNVTLHLEDYYEFLVAFFGSLMAKKPCVILHKAPNAPSQNNALLIDQSNFTQFLNTHITADKPYALELDSVFYLQTSGSSGESKNIAKTIAQMLEEARFLSQFLHVDERHYFISSVTHNHMYGLTFRVFLPLVCGGEVLAQELPFVELIFNALKPQNNILITSPTLLGALSQYPQITTLHSTQIISAGAKLEESIWQDLNALNLLEIYGSTECGVMCFKKSNTPALTRFESVKLSLKDECLVVQSPWCEEFASNDLAQIEGDSITLLGRADRIVKIADKRVNIDSIESTLNTLELIKTSRLDLLDSTTHLSGIIVLSQSGIELFKRLGKKEILHRIQTFLKPHFGGILRYIYIRDSLPLNAQGKITKTAFKESILTKHTPTFDITHHEAHALVATATIPISCFYFDWHFGDFPIVPGFIEIGFIVELAKHLGIQTEDILEITHAKWIKFIRPLDRLEIHLNLQESRLSFEIMANDTLGANGKIHIKKAAHNV